MEPFAQIPLQDRVQDSMQTAFFTIGNKDTILSAARLMKEKKFGSLIVIENLKPVGIITERDITFRVVAQSLSPARERVGTHMTTPIISIAQVAPLADAIALLSKHGIRRLPVHNTAGKVCGLITQSDILAYTHQASMGSDLLEGSLYYTQGGEQKSFEVFLANMRGRKGIVVTTLPHAYVSERYGLLKTPIIEMGKDSKVDQKVLDTLYRELHNSLFKHHNQLLFFHGLGDFIDGHGSKKMHAFIDQMRALIKETKSIAIVAINPHNPKEMNLLHHK